MKQIKFLAIISLIAFSPLFANQELLFNSAKSGYLSGVQRALALKADPNKTDNDLTALHCAIQNNHQNIVSFLKNKTNLKTGALVDGFISGSNNVFSKHVSLKHNGPVESVAWSPDGTRILTGSRDNTAWVWDLQGNRLTMLKHKGPVYSVAWSPDGKHILTGSDDKTAVVWDLLGNRLTILQHNGKVLSVAWSPDGTRILTGSHDNTAGVWDLDGNRIATLKHNDWVRSVAWSPDGTRILTGSYDNTAGVWDLQGSRLATLDHYDLVMSVAWSPDGTRILTGDWGGTAGVWDLQGNRLTTLNLNDPIYSVAWSPDGTRILIGTARNYAAVWGLDPGSAKATPDLRGELLTVLDQDDHVNSVAWSPDGTYILTGSHDNTVRVWGLGGSVIDSAVRNALGTSSTTILKMLLDEAQSLDGHCSNYLLPSICHAASKIKKHIPERYEYLCEVIKLLTKKPGCSVNTKDDAGKTALEWAQQYGLDEMARLLEQTNKNSFVPHLEPPRSVSQAPSLHASLPVSHDDPIGYQHDDLMNKIKQLKIEKTQQGILSEYKLAQEKEKHSQIVSELKKQIDKLHQEIDELHQENECCVCSEPFSIVSRVALDPCGHALVCEGCVKELAKCTHCREPITSSKRVFI